MSGASGAILGIRLLEALQKLNERERQIFLARTLEEEDFETLGLKFGLSYKGAAALYYRTIQKIRKCIEGGDKK
jgi:DNA-directed RNA polymerase specialized sigma24 family protein